jgi:hypothetical protein
VAISLIPLAIPATTPWATSATRPRVQDGNKPGRGNPRPCLTTPAGQPSRPPGHPPCGSVNHHRAQHRHRQTGHHRRPVGPFQAGVIRCCCRDGTAHRSELSPCRTAGPGQPESARGQFPHLNACQRDSRCPQHGREPQ